MTAVADDAETRLVAVDGGATGTRLRLSDGAGATLGEGTAGPSSLTLGVERAAANVAAAFEDACAAAGVTARRGGRIRLAAGLAGSRSAAAAAAFRAADPLGCAATTVVTDGFASLIGAHDGGAGTVLAVGTGVTGYALAPDGTVRQASGCGFPLGDEGGGAWIGLRAAQAYTWRLDGRLDGGRGGDAALVEALRGALGADIVSVQDWAREAGPTDYATLAPLVVTAAAAGDAVAERILADAAAELDRVIAAVEVAGAAGDVALLGGLAATFAQRLRADVRRRLVAPRGSALDGLVRLLRDPGRWGAEP